MGDHQIVVRKDRRGIRYVVLARSDDFYRVIAKQLGHLTREDESRWLASCALIGERDAESRPEFQFDFQAASGTYTATVNKSTMNFVFNWDGVVDSMSDFWGLLSSAASNAGRGFME